MKNPIIKTILFTSCVFLLPALLLFSGALNFLAPDGEIEKTAIGSLLFYWLLTSAFGIILLNLRKKPLEVFLFLFSFAVVFIVCETAVRFLFPYQSMMKFGSVPSKEFHHIYPPNVEMFAGRFEGIPVTVSTNEDGLRSKYGREEFSKADRKIMIMGDSFTFGLGVKQENTYPELLEKRLKKEFKQEKLAVLNTGIISYAPYLHHILFKKLGGFYKPDVVVMLLDTSDIGDDVKYEAEGAQKGEEIVFNNKSGIKLGYYGGITNFLSPFIVYPFIQFEKLFNKSPYDYYTFKLEIDGKPVRNRFFIYRHPLEKTEKYFNKTLENIKKTAKLVKESGAEFILVIYPRYHHWSKSECPENWEKGRYSNNEPFQFEYFRYFEHAKSHVDFPVINLLPDFQATKEFPLVFKNDPHWNEKGHEFVAKTLIQHLKF